MKTKTNLKVGAGDGKATFNPFNNEDGLHVFADFLLEESRGLRRQRNENQEEFESRDRGSETSGKGSRSRLETPIAVSDCTARAARCCSPGTLAYS